MKKNLGVIISAFLFCTSGAQPITANDSVNTAAGNTQMVFYSLSDGAKTVSSNTDWHLAVSVRPTTYPPSGDPLGGASIRINEANGVSVYQIPNFTADSFSVVPDTTGYHTWLNLHDADTLLNMGGLNDGYSGFNFGWGTYTGAPKHNVAGTKVFLMELPGGAVKKLFINRLDFDTAWFISYTNIDNSDSMGYFIRKADYPGKNFVYLDLLGNTVHDKEPLSSLWNLQFVKYAALDVIPGSTYGVVGVWSNTGTTVAKAEKVNVNSNDYSGFLFSKRLNSIGWDWKTYDMPNHIYTINDSLAYFVKTSMGVYYKIIFTGYNMTTGEISFYKEQLPTVSGIRNAENEKSVLKAFPNPANGVLNVVLNSTEDVNLRIIDLHGKVISENKSSGQFTRLSTSGFSNGVYLLEAMTNKNLSLTKFIVVH